MFNAQELQVIVNALGMAAKSAQRLSAREGQPESVAAEYRKVIGEVAAIQRKALTELDKLKAAKK